jgi:methionyl-tRNA synthetase
VRSGVSLFVRPSNGRYSFGNFVNRTLKFTVAKYQSTVLPSGDPPGPLLLPADDTDASFVSDVNKLIQTYNTLMDAVRLREGLAVVMQLSARGNLYLQGAGLNNALLASEPQRCAQVISRAINLIWILSAMVGPFMPATEESILKQLNCPPRSVPDVEEGAGAFGTDILEGHVLGQPDYLFTRIEESKAELWRGMFGSAAAAPNPGNKVVKGKGKAPKKDRGSTSGAGGEALVTTVKEKVKKVKDPRVKKEGTGTQAAVQSVGASQLSAAEKAAMKRDTVEATSEIPAPIPVPAGPSVAAAVE